MPNVFGGRENLDAIDFLRELNTSHARRAPGDHAIAEESTALPGVSRPVHDGGLGFTYKWNMGWMHDTLEYSSRAGLPALPPSRADVLHGVRLQRELHPAACRTTRSCTASARCSTRCRATAGRSTRRCAPLYGYMYAHPGKKLLFMGGEFGQGREWDHDRSLDWHLRDRPGHAGVESLVVT